MTEMRRPGTSAGTASAGTTSSGPAGATSDQEIWFDEEVDPDAADAAPRHTKTSRQQMLGALVFGGVVLAAAAVAAIPVMANREWFDELVRPFLLIPDALFVAGWLALIPIGGLAGWLAWRGSGGHLTTSAWAITAGLAVLWFVFLAGFQSIGGAMMIASLLVVSAVISTMILWRGAAVAGYLMVPVMAWSFYVFMVTAGWASLNFR